MGKIIRALANVVSLGALNRIDKARESYESTLEDYNGWVEDYNQKKFVFTSLTKKVKKLHLYIGLNFFTLKKIVYRDTFNKLTEIQKNMLLFCLQNKNTLTKEDFQLTSDCEYSSNYSRDKSLIEDDLAFAGMSLLLTPITAHIMVSDDICAYQKAECKIVEEAEKVANAIEGLEEAISKLVKKEKCYSAVKKTIVWYKWNNNIFLRLVNRFYKKEFSIC